jgi:hypothetical protein
MAGGDANQNRFKSIRQSSGVRQSEPGSSFRQGHRRRFASQSRVRHSAKVIAGGSPVRVGFVIPAWMPESSHKDVKVRYDNHSFRDSIFARLGSVFRLPCRNDNGFPITKS